jgi:hypothetical protein
MKDAVDPGGLEITVELCPESSHVAGGEETYSLIWSRPARRNAD